MDPQIDSQIIRSHNFVVKVAGHHTPTGRVSNKVPCITCVDIHFNKYVRAYVDHRGFARGCTAATIYIVYIYIYVYVGVWCLA
jgi:hypothetical protein